MPFADKEPLEVPAEERPQEPKGPLGKIARFIKDLIVRSTSTK